MLVDMKTEEILNLSFYSNDLSKNVTIREFFFTLMETLWIEKEGFSGKRPFGNSGWDSDLVSCLIKKGLINGKLDKYDYIDYCDWTEVDNFVIDNILKPLHFNDNNNINIVNVQENPALFFRVNILRYCNREEMESLKDWLSSYNYVVILNTQSGDWEGLFINDILISEGHHLGEGDSLYLLKMAEKYHFKSSDISIKYLNDEDDNYLSDCGNFPKDIRELSGFY